MKTLWLDEEPVSLSHQIKLLKSRGWQVDLCDNVEDALKTIAEQTYDVLFCDLILPRTPFEATTHFVDAEAGDKFIAEVRNTARHGGTKPSVRIVVVTARLSAGEALSKFEDTGDLFLVIPKPFKEESFLAALNWIEGNQQAATEKPTA